MLSGGREAPRKNTEVEIFTNELRRKRDELLAPLYFQELLEFAQDTCLSGPEAPIPARVHSDESLIVAALGSRGLKTALEIEVEALEVPESTKQYENEENEATSERIFTTASPIKFPDVFSGSVDYDILAAAENFGNQLIRESFKTLGHDAYEKADAFKNASSAEEQMEIILWLERRLRVMITEKGEPSDTPEQEHYHPAQLSPKFIGVYPNNPIPPTCLSVSIIATSFFKRAGVKEILHGDVVRTSIEDAAVGAAVLVGVVRDLSRSLGITISEPAQVSLNKMHEQVEDYLYRPAAHHAAVYARLIDGSWAQFDSNYRTSVHLEPSNYDSNLDEHWFALNGLAATAPNIELTAKLYGPDFLDIPSALYYVLEKHTPETIQAFRGAVRAKLETLSDEPLGEAMYEIVSNYFFDSDESQPDELLAFINNHLKEQVVVDNSGYKEGFLRNVFYYVFEKYVLWNETPDIVQARLEDDPQYRERRIEDIVALPFLMSIVLSKDYFINLFSEKTPHRILELGRPEQRIGLAVLSDFASHTNSPLSASFWLSHWPGNVAAVENLERGSSSDAEDSILFNNLVYQSIHPLTSLRNKDIIQKFIDIRTQPSNTES